MSFNEHIMMVGPFGDLPAAQVVENEVEVVERLKTWQDQLASTRSPDPFVGLPVDEQSPVRTSTRTNRALDFLKIKQVLLKGWTRQC